MAVMGLMQSKFKMLKATNSASVVDLKTALWVFDSQRIKANETGTSRAMTKPLLDFMS
jgi:hypothetical protein